MITENGRAVSIKAMTTDKKWVTISAKKIVLSCGTWETPRLLLASGIPGKAIGHYLVTHPRLVAIAKGERRQFSETSGVIRLMIPNPDNANLLITGIGPDPETYYWYNYQVKPSLKELKFRFSGPGIMDAR